jgi:hypothetical protein
VSKNIVPIDILRLYGTVTIENIDRVSVRDELGFSRFGGAPYGVLDAIRGCMLHAVKTIEAGD